MWLSIGAAAGVSSRGAGTIGALPNFASELPSVGNFSELVAALESDLVTALKQKHAPSEETP